MGNGNVGPEHLALHQHAQIRRMAYHLSMEVQLYLAQTRNFRLNMRIKRTA